jgi:hypothetical protein
MKVSPKYAFSLVQSPGPTPMGGATLVVANVPTCKYVPF